MFAAWNRFSVRWGVWWCHWLFLSAFFCVWMQIRYVGAPSVRAPRALPGPPEDQVAISPTQQPKLPYRQLTGAHTHWATTSISRCYMYFKCKAVLRVMFLPNTANQRPRTQLGFHFHPARGPRGPWLLRGAVCVPAPPPSPVPPTPGFPARTTAQNPADTPSLADLRSASVTLIPKALAEVRGGSGVVPGGWVRGWVRGWARHTGAQSLARSSPINCKGLEHHAQ
jgi:hypothetical protein